MRYLLIILLNLVFYLSATAQTEFGNNSTTSDGQQTATDRAWALIGSSYTFTAPSNGNVVELGAYLKSYSAGDFTADIGIYVFSGGVPTTLVGETQLVGNGGTATMYSNTGLSISLTSGTVYCIAVGNLTNGCRLHENTGVSGDQSLQTSSPDLLATWDEFLQYAEVLCAYGVFEASGGAVDFSPIRRKLLLQGE